jgi:hypothetical protein
MKKNRSIIIFIILLSSNLISAQDGWVNLFNGKDLSGWKIMNGDAKIEVVDGMIVGTTILNSWSTFLCTEETFTDFVLELEMLVNDDMNSGIMFRAESLPEYRNGKVFGYQCEVDPSSRAWSAGIYDEERRGWIYPVSLNPNARSAFKNGEWNKYRIECIGTSVKTWLNDVPVAYVIDDQSSEGFIGLQIHWITDVSEIGMQVKFKNIRIKTENLRPTPMEDVSVENLIPNTLCQVEKEQGYELLFDGKSTEHWQNAKTGKFPEKGWEVKDGVLTILANDDEESTISTDIITKEEFDSFELKFEFNLTEGSNSGIVYGIGNNGPEVGLKYQIIDNDNHPDAQKGMAFNRRIASLYDLIPAKMIESRHIYKPGGWNRGRILVLPNGKVQHWLNGQKLVEYNRGDAVYNDIIARSQFGGYEGFGLTEKSPVLIQNLGHTVYFRSLKIRERTD